MKNKYTLQFLVLILALWAFQTVKSQQDPQFSQYVFNGLVINPAYAGSHGDWTGVLGHRSQWLGMKGAPHSTMLTAHGMLKDSTNAFGGAVMNDYIGISNQTDIMAYYAYHLRFGDGFKLSMGLRAGVSVYSVKFDKLVVWDEGDPEYARGRRAIATPNVGAGLHLYHRYFYAGVAIPTILSYDANELLSIKAATLPHRRRHYLFTGGGLIKVADNVLIRPSFLLKYVWTAPLSLDANLAFGFYQRFWIGASYRSSNAVSGMLDLQVSPQLRIGYSFDWTLNKVIKNTAGSHEIVFGFVLGDKIDRVKNPRFF